VNGQRGVLAKFVPQNSGGNLSLLQRRAVSNIARRFRRVFGPAKFLVRALPERPHDLLLVGCMVERVNHANFDLANSCTCGSCDSRHFGQGVSKGFRNRSVIWKKVHALSLKDSYQTIRFGTRCKLPNIRDRMGSLRSIFSPSGKRTDEEIWHVKDLPSCRVTDVDTHGPDKNKCHREYSLC
jgi:hypothetical protein